MKTETKESPVARRFSTVDTVANTAKTMVSLTGVVAEAVAQPALRWLIDECEETHNRMETLSPELKNRLQTKYSHLL